MLKRIFLEFALFEDNREWRKEKKQEKLLKCKFSFHFSLSLNFRYFFNVF